MSAVATSPLTYEGMTVKEARKSDYINWSRLNGHKGRCNGSSNPAFTSARASEEEIEAAQHMCSTCPIMEACLFFSHTSANRDFDGVMGGRMLTHGMSDED